MSEDLLSEDVNVDVGHGPRLTSHFYFSGDPRIEEEVVTRLASCGKQLGVVSGGDAGTCQMGKERKDRSTDENGG